MPSQNKTIQLSGQYVVISQVSQDISDYRKDIIIAFHTGTPITLWKDYSAQAGQATQEIDLSTMAGMGIYASFDGATTITLQAKTITSLDGSGWSDFDLTTFTSADAIIYNIFTLPFKKIRVKTSAAVTMTVQYFLKT